MKRYELLLALNGIIGLAADSNAADLMCDALEELRDRVKAEPEPLAVVEAKARRLGDPKCVICARVHCVYVEFDTELCDDPTLPVTVTVTERKP